MFKSIIMYDLHIEDVNFNDLHKKEIKYLLKLG